MDRTVQTVFLKSGLNPGSHWAKVITDAVQRIEMIKSAHIIGGGHCGVTKTRKLLTP